MDFGGPEWLRWIVMLEAICAISLIGLAIHCSVQALEQENLIWWLPLALLAGVMAAAITSFIFTDTWLWLI